MVRWMITAISIMLVALFYSGCGTKGLDIKPELQGKLYTQSNMWVEKSKIPSTNYARGVMLPVNTEIAISSMGNKGIVFTANGGTQEYTYINIVKHSNLPTEELANKIFATKPVNLTKISPQVKNAIKQGDVINGMTKQEVFISRGLPPAIGTLNLDSNVWKYWQNRFVTRNVEFENGKVTRLVGWGTGNN